jgi:hypothetical protein
MIKRMIVTTAILSFFITAIKSDAEMKIAPGGVTFPDTTTQTTSATGGSGRWSANGFNIYYNSGNVGIGTSNPSQKLEVDKGDILVQGAGSFDVPGEEAFVFLGDTYNYIKGKHGVGVAIGTWNAGDVVTIKHTYGNVGIGMTDPGEKLEVAGNIKVSGSGNGVVFPDGTLQTTASAPTWHQILPSADRFKLVMNSDAAVLDKETGLVWEKSPDTGTRSWTSACTHCYQREVGGRKGWRLPTIEELASLVDTSQSNPTLPAGHPFIGVQSDFYWSSSTYAGGTSHGWGVLFNGGLVSYYDKSDHYYVWCVRGGYGHDAY